MAGDPYRALISPTATAAAMNANLTSPQQNIAGPSNQGYTLTNPGSTAPRSVGQLQQQQIPEQINFGIPNQGTGLGSIPLPNGVQVSMLAMQDGPPMIGMVPVIVTLTIQPGPIGNQLATFNPMIADVGYGLGQPEDPDPNTFPEPWGHRATASEGEGRSEVVLSDDHALYVRISASFGPRFSTIHYALHAGISGPNRKHVTVTHLYLCSKFATPQGPLGPSEWLFRKDLPAENGHWDYLNERFGKVTGSLNGPHDPGPSVQIENDDEVNLVACAEDSDGHHAKAWVTLTLKDGVTAASRPRNERTRD